MRNKYFIFLAICLFGNANFAYCYKTDTHQIITLEAYDRSLLKFLSFPEIFDMSDSQHYSPRDPATLFTDRSSSTLSAKDVMAYGSVNEDNGIRPMHHFLDPQNGNRALSFFAYNSVEWSLEENNITDQKNSYRDALFYYHEGLVARTESERNRYLGLMFQTIGHVVHHIQDMAQPQHVRNDAHCHLALCKDIDTLFGTDKHRPSVYEAYTNMSLAQSSLYRLMRDNNYSSGVRFWNQGFNKPIDFWIKPGGGMATFVSENFVSAGTNYIGEHTVTPRVGVEQVTATTNPEYPKPSWGNPIINKHHVDDSELCKPGFIFCELFGDGAIYFVTKTINDPVNKQTYTVSRFTSFGLFDDALIKKGKPARFSLNRFNYDAWHEVLITRAIAFTTGIINHFFRGSIYLNPSSTSNSLRFQLKRNIGTSSAGAVFNGTVQLFYDRVTGTRSPVQNASWYTIQLPADGEITKSFQYPADANGKFVLMFFGTIDGDDAIIGRHFTLEKPAVEPEPEPDPGPGTQCSVPLAPSDSTQGNFYYQYNVADPTAQTLEMVFEAYHIPDQLRIEGNGRVMVDTGLISGYHRRSFPYDPSVHGSTLDVYVNAPNNNTVWQLCVNCENTTQPCTFVSSRKSVDYFINQGGFNWDCSINGGSIDSTPVNSPTLGLELSLGNHEYVLDGMCVCKTNAIDCSSQPYVSIGSNRYYIPSGRGGYRFFFDVN